MSVVPRQLNITSKGGWDVSVSQVIRETRKAQGLTQGELGLPITQQYLSMIENGHRPLPADLRPMVARTLDDWKVYTAVGLEATDGVGPTVLDGPNFVGYLSAIRERFYEEMQEAEHSIDGFSTSRPAESFDEKQRQQVRHAIEQVIDLEQCCHTFVGELCKAFGFSIRQAYRDEHDKLRRKGLLVK